MRKSIRRHYRNLPLSERLAHGFERDDHGCWVWVGTMGPTGYGYQVLTDAEAAEYGVSHKRQKSHRVMWMVLHGRIPAGLCVCHSCDVPRCVNPDHLFLGNMRDNIQDAIRKCRFKSIAAVSRKLTPAQHAEICARLRAGGSVGAMAAEYGVTSAAISNLKKRQACSID